MLLSFLEFVELFHCVDLCCLSGLRNLWPFLTLLSIPLGPPLLGLMCSVWWMGSHRSFRLLFMFLRLDTFSWPIFEFCLLFFLFKIGSCYDYLSLLSAGIISVCHYTQQSLLLLLCAQILSKLLTGSSLVFLSSQISACFLLKFFLVDIFFFF